MDPWPSAAAYLPRWELGGVTGAVVAVDVIRAFQTAACAFASGATEIWLVAEVEKAFGGQNIRTLFKGGLFLRAYRVARDTDVAPVLGTHARYMYPSRTFVGGEDSAGRLYFAHVSTGFMTTSPPGPAPGGEDFSQSFIKFISDILERIR